LRRRKPVRQCLSAAAADQAVSGGRRRCRVRLAMKASTKRHGKVDVAAGNIGADRGCAGCRRLRIPSETELSKFNIAGRLR
jgi:hypothetical protein